MLKLMSRTVKLMSVFMDKALKESNDTPPGARAGLLFWGRLPPPRAEVLPFMGFSNII
jgi:hypothetical protein